VKWRNEYNLQLQSGYLDPQNLAAKPSLPWILWIALAVAYVAMLGWALALKRSPTK
jgi:Tfp pilus assembly protein PilO